MPILRLFCGHRPCGRQRGIRRLSCPRIPPATASQASKQRWDSARRIPVEIAFEDCAIPAQNLLGEEGQGIKLPSAISKAAASASPHNVSVSRAQRSKPQLFIAASVRRLPNHFRASGSRLQTCRHGYPNRGSEAAHASRRRAQRCRRALPKPSMAKLFASEIAERLLRRDSDPRRLWLFAGFSRGALLP